jgi:predicted nuclease with TOPRIM domain
VSGMAYIKRVDELIDIKNLSQQEMEVHKELIEECREREAMIEEYSARTQGSLQQLAQACETATERAKVLAASIEKVLDEIESLCLKLLPDDQFFHE